MSIKNKNAKPADQLKKVEEEKAAIEFTSSEATELLRIINQAVKVVGLEDGGNTANNGIYFTNKIQNAFK
jgi:hypothetical protein